MSFLRFVGAILGMPLFSACSSAGELRAASRHDEQKFPYHSRILLCQAAGASNALFD